MFKKTLVLSMAVMLMLVGLCSVASAAQNVANTSQKGSLLIWPKILTERGWDTIIMIGNDNTVGTTVKCLWMNEWQDVWNFEFPITMNQPVWFRASDGIGGPAANAINAFGEGDEGELKCFAIGFPVDNGAPEQQVYFNHLYGSAIVFHAGNGVAYEYPAWAFTARGPTLASNAFIGTPGVLPLTGLNTSGNYDACPAYLVYNFFTDSNESLSTEDDGPYFSDTRLALTPCYQDMRQERVPTCTKAKFDVWNENERKLTGAYRCLKCWFEWELDQINDPGWPYVPTPLVAKAAGTGEENFTFASLHTNSARFRVTGVSGGTVCAGVFLGVDSLTGKPYDLCPASKQVAVPFIGVKATAIRFHPLVDRILRDDPPDAGVANTGTTAGTWVVPTTTPPSPTPQILWDAADGAQQAQKK